MVEIIINNKKYSFEKNITVLQACEQAQISIPRFCYHEKLSVAGNCRMCLVEIEKSPKPVASCAMPINPGMVIFTETPLVKKAREAVLEFLLINHPLDCPICDQGGECDLQDITLNYGSDRSRYFEFKRGVEDKECGPIVKTIMTRCIHCTRCIRFLTELAGLEVFGAIGRGELMEIGTYLNKYLKTELSGNLVDLCPVGALTSKPYAFLARNWELKKIESIDYSDAIGSNIVLHTRNNATTKTFFNNKNILNDQILRILPKINQKINETWISDKTRFSFDGNSFNRNLFLEQKDFVKKNTLSLKWTPEFLQTFITQFKLQKKNFEYIGVLGTVSSLEESYFFLQFLKNFGNANLIIQQTLYNINQDLPNFYLFNNSLSSVDDADLILLVGVNPRTEGSMLNIRLRKQFFNKEILIGYIGPVVEFTFPTIHLGNSSKILLKIAEGKHFFCQKLRKAKKPLIIFGSEIGFRQDSQALQNLLWFLTKKNFLNLKNFAGLNMLHQNLSQVNFCDLGLSLNSKSFLYKQLINKTILQKEKKGYFFNNVDFTLSLNLESNFFCTLNTHNQPWNSKFTFNIPTSSVLEKDGLFVNTEGFVQKFFKGLTPPTLSRNSEDFFKLILKLSENVTLTNKNLFLEVPHLKAVNKQRIFFYTKIFNKNFLQKKVTFSPFKNNTKNFYMTDNISKNSKIMAECSLFLKNKSNFL